MLRIGQILVFSLVSLTGTQLWAQSDQDPEAVETGEAFEADEESAWWADLYGYVRAGFELVQHDENYAYVGANNGFVLHNARLGFSGGHVGWGLGFQISVDGAEDIRESINSPQGDLDVRLRDAFVREDLFDGMVGFQVGQFKLPFSAEELMSAGDLMFISRAVGLSGVPAGRGIEQEGVVFGRDLGLMLSSGQPVSLGESSLALGYYLAVSNGNGANELLNDNNKLAMTGRMELYVSDYLRLGGGVHANERTVGEMPNQHDEEDFAYSVDLLVNWIGLELFGQYTGLKTSYPTSGTSDREQVAYHAQVSYVFDQIIVPFAPAYRFAYFHPRSEGGMTDDGVLDLDSYRLVYHTFGLRLWVPESPMSFNFNYTLTGERSPRELKNDRFEALIQVVF